MRMQVLLLLLLAPVETPLRMEVLLLTQMRLMVLMQALVLRLKEAADATAAGSVGADMRATLIKQRKLPYTPIQERPPVMAVATKPGLIVTTCAPRSRCRAC